ncbi:T9SS type A sorting domain-containing protein, partial [candidate division KSB1 bacterium]|nr:T9SS type A sorting domain-containing protein [candidate division KSB1 bacterium]
SGMAIGDLDADGDIELIATNAEHVYVLSGLGSYNQSMIGWEGFKHDAWNTGLYGFEIPELPQIHSLTYNFSSQGWYLISLPVTAENDSLNKLFPTAVESFSWDVNNQNYVSSNVLKPEIGYWLAIPSSVTSIVKGIALETYTMQCKMGWNLLGSVLDTVEVSSITSDPIGSILAVFCWDANKNKYLPVDKILPKNGYWFAISQDCEIFINSSTSNLAMKKYNLSGLTESFVNLFNNNPPPPPHTFSNVLANQILPTLFVLNQNYPNPFNPETIIKYQLPKLSNVELVIYNIMGQKVITLVNEKQAAGFYQVRWNGINSLGNQVSTGIYLYKLQAENFQDMKKMVFIR